MSSALPPCEFRSRLLTRSRAVCTWDGPSGATETPRVVPFDQCRVCSRFAAPPTGPENLADDPLTAGYLEAFPCAHRGEQIETRSGELCGTKHLKFPVFVCALHGKCSLTRICTKQRLWNCAECQSAGEHLSSA